MLALLLLLLAAFGLRATIRALIRPAFRALLVGRGLTGCRAFTWAAFLPTLIRPRATAVLAPVIPAGALLLALMLAWFKAGRALLANPRGRGRAEVFLIKRFGRDQPEAHGIQHRAQVFALDPQTAGQITRQQRGGFTRQMAQFAGDAFRHIQAQ